MIPFHKTRTIWKKLALNKLNGQVFRSGASFSDGCNKCRCNEGIVSCLGGSLTCQYYEGESTTPPPGVCKFEDELRLSGEIFMSKTEGCSRCWCIDGAIRCKFVRGDECENEVTKRRSLELS